MPCDATLTFGDVLFVRCDEDGEHVAHGAFVVTEARRDQPRFLTDPPWPRSRVRLAWYDTTGHVLALENGDAS